MTRAEAVRRLQSHEPELRNLGVAKLALFGSVARGEEELGSDIDLAVTLADRTRLTLLDLVAIQQAAEVWLGTSVDVVSEPARKPSLRTAIDRDRVSVF